MDAGQLEGVIRSLVLVFSGWAMSMGFTHEQWLAVAGAIAALVSIGWSLYSNSTRQQVRNIAQSDSVHEIAVAPALAMAIEEPKVVGRRSDHGKPKRVF